MLNTGAEHELGVSGRIRRHYHRRIRNVCLCLYNMHMRVAAPL